MFIFALKENVEARIRRNGGEDAVAKTASEEREAGPASPARSGTSRKNLEYKGRQQLRRAVLPYIQLTRCSAVLFSERW